MRVLTCSLLLTSCSLLAVPPASAAPLLIAEFSYGNTEPHPVSPPPVLPTTVPFGFNMGPGQWSRQVELSDVGQTFMPDPAQFALMATAWPLPDTGAAFRVTNEPGIATLPNLAAFLNQVGMGNFFGLQYTVHVANGQAYPLSDVAITIDHWEVIIPGGVGGFATSGAMTVRFYAEAVPECSTLYLVSIAFCCVLSHRKRPSSLVPPVNDVVILSSRSAR